MWLLLGDADANADVAREYDAALAACRQAGEDFSERIFYHPGPGGCPLATARRMARVGDCEVVVVVARDAAWADDFLVGFLSVRGRQAENRENE